MTLSLSNKTISDGGTLYYTAAYHLLIETHLNWLIYHPKTYRVSVDSGEAYKYIGDLYGLLSSLGIPTQHHWAVMRMNNYRATTDYTNDTLSLVVPDAGTINGLVQIFATGNTTLA